jgi:hypothetical protein
MTVKITKPEINVREQLNELKKPTGVAGEAMLRAETPQEQQALIGISGRRNFIMNGRGFIDQRGKSGASLNAGEFSLDRWSSSTAGTTMTQLSGGGFKSARTSGIAWSRISHRVEDCYNAIGTNELTISFDIKWNTHSGNDNSMVYLRWLQDNGTETGTAAALDISKTGLSSKEKFTKTFTMPSDATNPEHLMILFYGCNGTASVWDFELDNIQLELGKVATPFEHRSYGEELALCLRYCYVLDVNNDRFNFTGTNYTSSNNYFKVQYPVMMRANPTTSVNTLTANSYSAGAGTASGVGVTVNNTRKLSAQLYTAISGTAGHASHTDITSGQLVFNAEL